MKLTYQEAGPLTMAAAESALSSLQCSLVTATDCQLTDTFTHTLLSSAALHTHAHTAHTQQIISKQTAYLQSILKFTALTLLVAQKR